MLREAAEGTGGGWASLTRHARVPTFFDLCDDDSDFSEDSGDAEAGDAMLRALFSGGGESESADDVAPKATDLEEWGGATDVCIKLPPEVERGSVEYKLKLVNCTAQRIEELTTQMAWRLEAGGGSATYMLGVQDDGVPAGLGAAELEASIATVRTIAAACDARVEEERRMLGADGVGSVARIAVERTLARCVDIDELRVAVLGAQSCGKTSLVALLAHDARDNGLGLGRMKILQHLHEAEAGTSSINRQLLGFDAAGRPTNLAARFGVANRADIVRAAMAAVARVPPGEGGAAEARGVEGAAAPPRGRGSGGGGKLVELLDLAGARKFLKTTLRGLTGHRPDYAMLVLDARVGVERASLEHWALSRVLGVPTFVVVTKHDCCRAGSAKGRSLAATLAATLAELAQCLSELAPHSATMPLTPRLIESEADAAAAAAALGSSNAVPVFAVSSVSAAGIAPLRAMLFALPLWRTYGAAQAQSEVFIAKTYGANIVCGLVSGGTVTVGDGLLLGPLVSGAAGAASGAAGGTFARVRVRSIEAHHLSVRSVSCGHSATFSLSYDDDAPAVEPGGAAVARPRPRRGMVLAAPALAPRAVWTFVAEIRGGGGLGDDGAADAPGAGSPVVVLAARESDLWMTSMENNCRQVRDLDYRYISCESFSPFDLLPLTYFVHFAGGARRRGGSEHGHLPICAPRRSRDYRQRFCLPRRAVREVGCRHCCRCSLLRTSTSR